MKNTNLENLRHYLLKAQALMINGLVSGSFFYLGDQDQDINLDDLKSVWGVTDQDVIFFIGYNGLTKTTEIYHIQEKHINEGQLIEGGVIINYEGKTLEILILCVAVSPMAIEDHPNFKGFIRAFWRRIEPFKNRYGKELPEEIPDEFTAHMATAGLLLQEDPFSINK